MIPRTKVNYNFSDILRSFFLSNRCHTYRNKLCTALKNFLNIQNVLLTPSGRSGLYYILKAIDRPKVLIPAYTCKAVGEAAALAGKEIIYIEVSKDNFNMSPAALEQHLSPNTIVIATHQFGFPCDIEKIIRLAKKRNAIVVEDAAASLGTCVAGQLTGTFGEAAFFSFDSSKLISVPLKGGFLTAKDPDLYERICKCYASEIKKMPWIHKIKLLIMGSILIAIENPILYRFFHTLRFGLTNTFTAENAVFDQKTNEYYLYDFTEWQSYIANSQVKKIKYIIKKRQELFSSLRKSLLNNPDFILPPEDTLQEWACIRFPIRIKSNKLAYYKKAAQRGVDFAFSFTYISSPEKFKRSHNLANSVLDIPYYLKLKKNDITFISNTLNDMTEEQSLEH